MLEPWAPISQRLWRKFQTASLVEYEPATDDQKMIKNQ